MRAKEDLITFIDDFYINKIIRDVNEEMFTKGELKEIKHQFVLLTFKALKQNKETIKKKDFEWIIKLESFYLKESFLSEKQLLVLKDFCIKYLN